MKSRNIKITTLLAVILLASLACGQLSVGIEDQDSSNNIDYNTINNGSTNTVNDTQEETPTETSTQPEPIPVPEGAQYWVETQHPYHGFRLAVPCFWDLSMFSMPSPSGDGQGSYSIVNYPEDYPRSFPRSVIPEEFGAIKVTFNFISLPFNQLPNDTTLEGYVIWEERQSGPDDPTKLVSIEETTINGMPARIVTMEYTENYQWSEGTYRYYLLRISPEFLMSIYDIDSPDFQGILNSITLDPQAAVPLPNYIPGDPPIGVDAACMP